METGFTLWSLKAVLEKIPFDTPINTNELLLDFSEIDAPYYVKSGFKALFIYDDSISYDASCSIISPRGSKNTVIVVIVVKKCYENALSDWLKNHNKNFLNQCCLRRALYCHEACHLIAVLRAFPSDRSSMVHEDFIAKIRGKFNKSVNTAQELKTVYISMEKSGGSPSTFDKEHFRYENDDLNYFRLYSELMLDYERMCNAVQPLVARMKAGKVITFMDVANETLVDRDFFLIFPEKHNALNKLLAEELS